jgi:hypothetical protein
MDRLRTRKTDGHATTEKDLKKAGVWKPSAISSTATSEASSPLDTPERRSRSSSLSSLSSNEERNIIPFPELNVPLLDFDIPKLHLEPSLRRQKTQLFTLTSTIPDYDLNTFFSLAQPKNAMPTEMPQIFHGDGRKSENPADFLKSFNRAMRQQSVTTSMEKMEAFSDYLGTGSDAEIWFKALTQSSKTNWLTFVAAFEDRWPPIIVAEKTKAEYERELMEHLLSDAEVGTKTTLYDRECWTHEAWAAKALQLASRAGIAASASMIWQVRGRLPSVIKDLLKADEYANWTEFTTEVKELKGNRVLEKKEQHSKQELEVNRLRADVARLQQGNPEQNSLAALQNQFARMSVNSAKPANTLPSNSTITRIPTPQVAQNTQPTFRRQQTAPTQPLVITEDMKNSIQQLVSSLLHHPDTPAGHAAYAAQIMQWNMKWGEYTRVTPETGYPLKPGTAAIASSECFNCGTHGHNSRNCVLPADHAERLSRKEAAWRAIVSKVLGPFNRATATPISLVTNHASHYTSAWIEEIPEQEEGKVSGSA